MNSTNEVKIRKCESTLRISGIGIVILGLWSLARAILYFAFSFSYYETILGSTIEGMDRIGLEVFLIIILILDILFRLYIGRSAMLEAKGKKSGIVYVIFAFIIVAFSVYSIVDGIISPKILVNSIANVFLDTTSLIITIDLISSAIRIKKYRKMQI